jgi:hypothetical protein
MRRENEGQEARETAPLASDTSEARSARPGARQAPKRLRQRVEAAIDEALDLVGGDRSEGAIIDAMELIRAALEPPKGRAAGYQAKARAAAIARGDCTRCLSRRARPGKRTCGSARCRPRPKVTA